MTAIIDEAKEIKKETVGLPVRVKLKKGENTGIVSIFTGTPRRDRRKHLRQRVRERSVETFHPENKEARKEALDTIRAKNLRKVTRK